MNITGKASSTVKKLININLASLKIKKLLETKINIINCKVFLQVSHAVLVVVVNHNKPFISAQIKSLSKDIERLIGVFKYKIEENKNFVSVQKVIENFKFQLKQKSTPVPFFMSKLGTYVMDQKQVKGVIILIKGVIFGARKSHRKICLGKQKYTGSFLKDYVSVVKETLEIPKGTSGLTVKIFYKTPAKYDLKSYFEKFQLQNK